MRLPSLTRENKGLLLESALRIIHLFSSIIQNTEDKTGNWSLDNNSPSLALATCISLMKIKSPWLQMPGKVNIFIVVHISSSRRRNVLKSSCQSNILFNFLDLWMFGWSLCTKCKPLHVWCTYSFVPELILSFHKSATPYLKEQQNTSITATKRDKFYLDLTYVPHQ